MSIFLFLGFLVKAQLNINELLAADPDDAERFTNDYLAPVSEGAPYNLSIAGYNIGETKPFGGLEITIMGNLTPFNNKEDKKAFVLNTAEYENLGFVDGSTSKSVSIALGDMDGIRVFVEGEIAPGIGTRQEFTLPTGLASENIDFIPSAFLQASVGILKGTEIKARFLSKIDTNEVSIGLYAGLGYMTGTSETDILGTFVVQSGPFQETYVDPFSVKKSANGVMANIGTKVKLGFFRINVDYTLAEFNNLSFGLGFGFR